MPELPEVQTIVATLSPRIAMRPIRALLHLRDDMLLPRGFDLGGALAGRTIHQITRRGKRIIILLDNAQSLLIHLGMTGRLTIEPASTPLAPHTHLVLDLANHDGRREQLRFRDPRRFGQIRWLGSAPCDDDLGPEPLSMRPAQLARNLGGTRRPIKSALLDQTIVAGLGNIYVDESLFDARIHPLCPANQLTSTQIAALTRSIKKILRRAIKHRGSSIRDYVDADGARGAFQNRHRVYARENKPCPRCRTPIQRIIVTARSTHFCPQCQPRR
jgi:formamidopyrimidine-DNA glycosylase